MKKLNERMKQGELYVVFSGLDHEGMALLSYSYPASVPRIYSKDALDPRVWDQHPICKSIETAQKRLSAQTYAVVLPLSKMIDWWGEYEVRRWASPQRSVSPTEVRAYISKCLGEPSAERSEHSDKHRESVTKWIAFNHRSWIAANPEGALADLLEFLDLVRFEILRYDADELIVNHIDDLGIAADYLSDWDDPSVPVDEDELPSFGYRLENLDEDLQHVDELIDLVGDSFKVADLPSWEESLKPSSLKLVG